MTVQIGLLLALACAFATNLAFLWKHRGAVAAPEIDMRHPLRARRASSGRSGGRSASRSRSSPGCCTSAALALAPISLVQAVISGGLVFLAVLADRLFGFELGRREWLGVGLTAVGLAFLGLTVQSGSTGSHSSYSISAMIAFEGGMIVLGTLLLLSHRVERVRQQHGVAARRRGGHPLRGLRCRDQGAHRHRARRSALDRQPVDAWSRLSPRSRPSTLPPAAFRSARASR